jgi:hypothetical protein
MKPLFDRADAYGFDMYVGPVPGGGVDMLPDGRGCSGVEFVRNKIVYRSMQKMLVMTSAPGGIIDFGEDVREWVGSAVSPSTAAQRQTRLTLVYGRIGALDPGSIRVAISAPGAGAGGGMYDFFIAVTAKLTDGRPVRAVMGINAVTVDLLAQGT